jgi:RNA polymerase sigma-70 factor (ECF subfamily)
MEAAALDPTARGRRPLVDASIAGDRDAFRLLVEPCVAGALGLAAIVTGSQADAADAVQDALLSAWRGLHGLRDADAFPAWFGSTWPVPRCGSRGGAVGSWNST